jgi:predicted Rossmann fold nucleotide-binding protein DprA/Smf involved in DNA uptake
MALALKLEKWIKAGVWVINRSDPEYPESIKSALSNKVPPILFGIGDKTLLSQNYIGIVGSRKIENDDISSTRQIVGQIHSQGFGVVSGGAKGIDEHSMTGILDQGGFAMGVLAESLIKKSTDGIYRRFIQDNMLVLISPFNPEAGFNVGNAMARNKLIYILSKATIVVKSETKGGTWSGAEENLKEKWVPLWVNEPKDSKSAKGNQEIVKKGGQWLPQILDISLLTKPIPKVEVNQGSLFNSYSIDKKAESVGEINEPEKKIKTEKIYKIASAFNPDGSFFDFFIHKLYNKFQDQDFNKEEIISQFELTSKQVEEWLKLALDQKLISKKMKPIRYQLIIN